MTTKKDMEIRNNNKKTYTLKMKIYNKQKSIHKNNSTF